MTWTRLPREDGSRKLFSAVKGSAKWHWPPEHYQESKWFMR
ncbi:hypothetical protein POX_c04756 [Penicillium oxalicum]|nr:hypothetical protein POX_c04756 [Penicillium oxalicum]KAI2791876.1 hypothetical protein POX_c04756 [Penicillium oxalicum]